MPHSPALTRTWHTVHCGFCRAPFVIVTVPMRTAMNATEVATCPACDVSNPVTVSGHVEETVFAAAMGLHSPAPVFSDIGERGAL